ncbi:DNA polymerase III subunit gamma/tau [Pseudodesulfovibrio sp. JC047]|uniref:DNA polymerase III subunit gamma/tau n=1 Tax=Pseudodesulfovibrio sp. JC047 TaxID=2683199 RepID=UPI0013D8791C|nr:DNA polymerase III subunit gamma/tau [Pseudodesulfovibrio sp. JC047]NDV20155.1 DNA polymerase III subunit gamma/tau [Pseudodesulfovibrio sp. JC047]
MSTSNLTAKYRPQTFEDVAGQKAIKSILSRAAAQDKIAPAYLFSGTRGVGKTTIARIFAKALNCVNGPTGEPCNECANCKQITAGVAVDVIEIDGASNRGIDDARRLKEDIGYAPIECRYKVFIIDEAHMLTKEAFNALLKTLEEPPPRATFIMATTEHHKFPATIISRCQHYTFKMLTQMELVDHLENIMTMEGLQYEPGALEIIAKRGAGSVRDSMSLLGQALAMGEDVLKEADVRGFLGLAGQDVFFGLMEAMYSRNLVAVGTVLRQVLDQGLDLGFFLRELTNCWRNMFLLRQAGKEALPLLGLSGEEAKGWMGWAEKFEPAHIHACWQMTLDGQRKVMTSLEPALALELLLLNLTSLPELIRLESMTAQTPASGTPQRPMGGSGGMQGGSGPGQGFRQGQGGAPGNGQRFAPQHGTQPMQQARPQVPPQTQQRPPIPPQAQQRTQAPSRQSSSPTASMRGTETSTPPAAPKEPEPAPVVPSDATPLSETANPPVPPHPAGNRNWTGFLAFVEERNGQAGVKVSMLHLTKGSLVKNELVVTCRSRTMCGNLTEKNTFKALEALAKEYFGSAIELRIETGKIAVQKSDKQLMEDAENNPAVNKIIETFGAQIVSVSPRKQ